MTQLLTACKKETPVEMLFGKWQVVEVYENGFDYTSEYLKDHSPYLVLKENGNYTIGLMDKSQDKSWIAIPEKNELTLTQESIYDDLKKWEVRASDNQLILKYAKRNIRLKLIRIQELPPPPISGEEDLVGKWTVDKVTINGINSTKNYPHQDRWIVLAKNGRFYNGASKGDSNAGFWQVNDLFNKLEFRKSESAADEGITFHITEKNIWYEKERTGKEHIIRIYFKKEDI